LLSLVIQPRQDQRRAGQLIELAGANAMDIFGALGNLNALPMDR
jgi:hypothetical protein